jgi:hypothetical protein
MEMKIFFGNETKNNRRQGFQPLTGLAETLTVALSPVSGFV